MTFEYMNTLLADANLARRSGDIGKALDLYTALLGADPCLPDALLGAAICLEKLSREQEAADHWRRLLDVQPKVPLAHCRLGLFAFAANRVPEALGHFEAALALDGTRHDALHYRAVALQALRRYAEALAAFDLYFQSVGEPSAQAVYHHAKALKDAGRSKAATDRYADALAASPDNQEVLFSRALLRLMAGDWQGGWDDYERRWTGWDRVEHERPPASSLPEWGGERPDPGAGLVLYAEQGMGDTLQFYRYVHLARTWFDRVMMVVQPPLVRLLAANAPDGVTVSALPSPAAEENRYTHYLPLLSIARAMGTRPDTVPLASGYLQAEPGLREKWRSRLPTGRLLAGLVWEGGKGTRNAGRDLSVADLRRLVATPDIEWVSLQKAAGISGRRITDLMAEVGDFADTAALIASLDLVISVDTSVAHLAGAMGKPVWLLNRFESEWRWMRGRQTTPWYDSMRIFNQPQPGDWAAVIDEVQGELGALLDRRHPGQDSSGRSEVSPGSAEDR